MRLTAAPTRVEANTMISSDSVLYTFFGETSSIAFISKEEIAKVLGGAREEARFLFLIGNSQFFGRIELIDFISK